MRILSSLLTIARFFWLSIGGKRGVTAIEYGLIAALIAVAIITAVTLVGTNLSTLFTAVAGHLHT
jgi:pilus assembly protein Flp/PilA